MANKNLKEKLAALRSKVFGVPAIVGQKSDVSTFLRVGKSQVAEANAVAMDMGCGAPYRKSDGKFEGTRAEKKKYMQELNRRRTDSGQPRFVNLDGGYGDEI